MALDRGRLAKIDWRVFAESDHTDGVQAVMVRGRQGRHLELAWPAFTLVPRRFGSVTTALPSNLPTRPVLAWAA
jgi:hypothetical protein